MGDGLIFLYPGSGVVLLRGGAQQQKVRPPQRQRRLGINSTNSVVPCRGPAEALRIRKAVKPSNTTTPKASV